MKGGKVFRMAGNGEGFVSIDRGLESKTSTILSPHLPSFLLVGRIRCLAVIGSFPTQYSSIIQNWLFLDYTYRWKHKTIVLFYKNTT